MVKTISRKNVKYIVQVSQTGLKRKKKKPNAPESAEGKKKKKATGKTRSSTIGDREYATCMEREGKKKKKVVTRNTNNKR